jgi:hypothetical protein
MGMYDEVYVHANIDLPEFPFSADRKFQTKHFDCLLDRFAITDNGRLTKETCVFEDVPEEERPYYNDPEYATNPLLQYCGSIRKNVIGIHDTEFHGEFNFYSLINTEWFEYKAIFVHGELLDIQKV